MSKNIAWICDNVKFVSPYAQEIELRSVPHRMYFKYFDSTANKIWEDLKNNKYDLIILNPLLLPGEGYPVQSGREPGKEPKAEDFCEIGLDLVDRIRKGFNSGTPIVITVPRIELLGEALKKRSEKQRAPSMALLSIIEDIYTLLPVSFYKAIKGYLE